MNFRDRLGTVPIRRLVQQAAWFLTSRLALLGFCCAVPFAAGYTLGWVLS
ncbi:MAG: hypothetical protein IBX68_07145 [Dehalococcoidia bacterium]|nr:hypothetical protein [Dehalococcoidia bacterium]